MVVVLTGLNQFAVQEKLAELRKTFVDKYGSDGIESYDGEQIETDSLSILLSGASLFAANRLIIIRHLSENKLVAEKFVEYAEKIPTEVTVVLVESQLDKRTVYYKELKKISEFNEFEVLSEGQLISWIQKRVVDEGGQINTGSAKLLFEYVGNDQLRLVNEIAKLVAYEPNITDQTIQQLVEKNPRDTVFQLLEYALSGRRDKALGVLDGLEKAFEDPFQTANMLVWQAQVLAVVKSAGDRSDADIAKETKFNPYVIHKTKTLANRMDRTQLRRILDVVAKLDLTLKSTSVEPWRAVEQAVLSI